MLLESPTAQPVSPCQLSSLFINGVFGNQLKAWGYMRYMQHVLEMIGENVNLMETLSTTDILH